MLDRYVFRNAEFESFTSRELFSRYKRAFLNNEAENNNTTRLTRSKHKQMKAQEKSSMKLSIRTNKNSDVSTSKNDDENNKYDKELNLDDSSDSDNVRLNIFFILYIFLCKLP